MIAALLSALALAAPGCQATPPDALGPFYVPGAPARTSVGTGHALSGRVLSARTCRPVARAKVEVWQAGPAGEYGPRWRATLRSGADGRYRFQGPFPPPYEGRPSHVHLRVSAPGYATLVTQAYPRAGARQTRFDLVLRPAG